MFDFYYQQGSSRRKLFQVKGSHCSIGSARNNDLVLESRRLAKRHAEFRLEADGLHMRDLGSMSGTWVNRERIMDHGPLSDLDEIEVGDISLTIRAVRQSTTLPPSVGRLNGDQQQMSLSANEQDAGFENQAGRENEHALSGSQKPKLSVSDTGHGNSQSSVEADADVVEFNQELAYWASVVHEQLLYQMDLRRKDVNRMTDDQLREESSGLIADIINSLETQIPDTVDRVMLLENVLNESVGLGPLETFLSDEGITEIMVNNYREIFVERDGKLERSRMQFSSDATVFAVIERIITPLGRRIDESSPIVDARLKDGSRVNAVIPPLALKGPSLTIRKFPKHRMQFSDLVASGSVSEAMVEFLRICVEMRKNIVVSGGTGSGKTTLFNELSNFIPLTDRVVTIEDAAELKLVQPNLVSLESRPINLEGKGEVPIRDLVKNSLRMRPDRIVVGECRGGEALDMLQAMNTGHDGSLTTIHANTPRDVLSRLEVLVLMAGMDLPVGAIREQVASAVDLIIQQSRFPCGRRKITRITEVVGVESGTVQLQDLFRFEQQGVDDELRVRGFFTATGAVPTFYEDLRAIGVNVDLSFFTPQVSGEVG